MRSEYFITMDTHCRTTDLCVKTARGKLVRRERVATTVPSLRQAIGAVPRPRHLAFEEGALAGWLYRELQASADSILVCDPRRNAHIAKDGDKDDAIDAEKLNDLFRAGFLRPVHQVEQADQAAAKQLVGAYHKRVRRRVAEQLQLLALCRRWGVMLTSANLTACGRPALRERLAEAQMPAVLLELCDQSWQSLEQAWEREAWLKARVEALARSHPVMRRVAQLPGYGPIRSATLVVCQDTPWRFKSKAALWKYVGIGLRRQHSGAGRASVEVEQECNRLLRGVAMGAAQCAIDQDNNVFARRYRHWVQCGLSVRNARRNVARDQVTAIWGMWKSDKAFDETMIAAPPAD